MNTLLEAIGLKEKKNAANTLLNIGKANQRPPPISTNPMSSSGEPKQWVQTPGNGSFGSTFSPGWVSPAPKLQTPTGGRRKKARKTRRRKTRRHR